MNLAFVGFKHRHTGAIYQEAAANPDITVLGAWEDTEDGKALADDDYIPTGAKLRVTFDKMPVFSSTFILIGDVTYDAKITAADARRVLRFAAGLERYKGDLVLPYAANTAGNTDEITAADAREIIRCSAGIGRPYGDWYDYHCELEKNDRFLINDNL